MQHYRVARQMLSCR